LWLRYLILVRDLLHVASSLIILWLRYLILVSDLLHVALQHRIPSWLQDQQGGHPLEQW
jgi:hypothetical protein